MSPLFSENDTLNKIKTLAVINILEPINKAGIIKSFSNGIGGDQITLIIDDLVNDGFVTEEKGFYRITYKGSSFSISRKANKLRDVQRMKHLFKISKQRGGDSVGR